MKNIANQTTQPYALDTMKYECTIRSKKQNYTHMKVEDTENAINQNKFWDMWNKSSRHYPSKMVTSGEHILKINKSNQNVYQNQLKST